MTEERAKKLAIESLGRLMSDISEEHYCAGWNGGLEFDLWAIVRGGNPNYGMGDVSPENIQELRQLSEDCGGWHDGENFVPLRNWLNQFSEWFEVKNIPAWRDHLKFIRENIGKSKPAGETYDDSDILHSSEKLTANEAELPKVKAEAERGEYPWKVQ